MMEDGRSLRMIEASTGSELHLGDDLLIKQIGHRQSRPYLHPIRSPHQLVVLTEDSPSHHPWQHGLYTGLNAVNGFGFWTEGLFGDEEHRAADGRIECVASGTEPVAWWTRNEWIAPDNTQLLHDQMRWEAQMAGGSLVLDLEWHLVARVDCTFGKYSYGGLFLRVPVAEDGGNVDLLTADGTRSQAEANAGRSRWVALDIEEQGKRAGIAIIDHPNNGSQAVRWRIDGEMGVGPSPCIDSPWSLDAGESRTFRYRIVVYDGATDPTCIDSLVPGRTQ